MARLSRWLRRRLVGLGLALVGLAGLLALSLAMSVATWRTGRLPAPPLDLAFGQPPASLAHRLWIDTDAACGAGPATDPDDCFAIALLARDPNWQIVGISTVFGNAELADTNAATRKLMSRLHRARPVPIWRGLAARSSRWQDHPMRPPSPPCARRWRPVR